MTKKNETINPTSTMEGPHSAPLLSRAECNIMRGFAILIIIIDNFTHKLNGVFPDNEYVYRMSSVEGVMNNVMHPDSLLPFNLLSFYCPYGVLLFIFLSGYGLVLKYEKGSGQGVSHKSFLVSHYNKMFSMQVKGLSIYLASVLLFSAAFIPRAQSLFFQIFLVGNLVPNNDLIPGPYWFFGMIVEMYVIFRLIIYKRSDTVLWVLAIISLLAMAFCAPAPSGKLMYYLRVNCFLAILPFCMGVYAARHLNNEFLSVNKLPICLGLFILSFILLTLSKFNFYSWLIMPIFIIITAVTFVKLMCRVKLLDQVFDWLGALSGVLFVVHPAVRVPLLSRANEIGHPYTCLFIFLFVSIGLSILLKPVFSKPKK